jgi:hypothetical protein
MTPRERARKAARRLARRAAETAAADAANAAKRKAEEDSEKRIAPIDDAAAQLLGSGISRSEIVAAYDRVHHRRERFRASRVGPPSSAERKAAETFIEIVNTARRKIAALQKAGSINKLLETLTDPSGMDVIDFLDAWEARAGTFADRAHPDADYGLLGRPKGWPDPTLKGKGGPKDMGQRAAAYEAARLLKKHRMKITLTRNGNFVKLAKAIDGRGKDLFNVCRVVKADLNRS